MLLAIEARGVGGLADKGVAALDVAPPVGIVHQLSLSLREARTFDVFILDTDQLDVDRLGK